MEFIKVYLAGKALRLSLSAPAKNATGLGGATVLVYRNNNLRIELSERKTARLNVAHIRLKTTSSKPFTIATPDCPMITMISLDGAANLKLTKNTRLILANETSVVYFSTRKQVELQPLTSPVSLLIIGSNAKRRILPEGFQLIEDFFTKMTKHDCAILFPGVYPITTISRQNLLALFQSKVTSSFVETTYRTVIAREAEARTKAYQTFQKVKTTPKRDEAIFEVIERVLLHLEDAYSIESLAASIFTNANSLNRRFKQATGQSIFSFLRQTKTARGMDLLTHTTQPFEEIAAMLGFCSKLQFARFLKRQTGMTPSQFRHTNQGLSSAQSQE